MPQTEMPEQRHIFHSISARAPHIQVRACDCVFCFVLKLSVVPYPEIGGPPPQGKVYAHNHWRCPRAEHAADAFVAEHTTVSKESVFPLVYAEENPKFFRGRFAQRFARFASTCYELPPSQDPPPGVASARSCARAALSSHKTQLPFLSFYMLSLPYSSACDGPLR